MLLGVRQLATRRRCPLDRVQTITLICTSLPNATYRCVSATRFFAKQLAILDYVASRVLQVEVDSPRLLCCLLCIFHDTVSACTNGHHSLHVEFTFLCGFDVLHHVAKFRLEVDVRVSIGLRKVLNSSFPLAIECCEV